MMTLLIAGHETTAAVLTWTFHCIVDRPDVVERMREEVRRAAAPPPCSPCSLLATVLIEGPPPPAPPPRLIL
jgi:cytochrome P450